MSLGETDIDWFFWGPIMSGKVTYTEANTMPWEAFCELHECLDYEADYNYKVRQNAKNN